MSGDTGHDHEVRAADFDALLLDVDGVLTRTAAVHAAAWKEVFDAFFAARTAAAGERLDPFDAATEYAQLVDGKPRLDGVRSVLAARAIALPEGAADDEAATQTVHGLANAKNACFRRRLRADGVEVYVPAVDLVRAARARGLRTAAVSSSRNAALVLDRAGVQELFDACIDGVEAERLGLRGKPAPDPFLAAARRLGARPERTIVVEDARAGVRAGRAGGFGLVVGVDRGGRAETLRDAGADIVVASLAALSLSGAAAATQPPSALAEFESLAARLRGRQLAVFLDYDGTLTPIVERPEDARLPPAMRDAVRRLAERCRVAVVSGRDRADVQRLVGLEELYYAGSHGFDISGPGGCRMEHADAEAARPALETAADALERQLADVTGAAVERKRFAVAIHYRRVADAQVERVRDTVQRVGAGRPELRQTGGKKVFELRPRVEWDKGKAVVWLLEALGLAGPEVISLYLGDDETDEDAFAALAARDAEGLGILVADAPRPTAAAFRLRDPDQAREFLERLGRTRVSAG